MLMADDYRRIELITGEAPALDDHAKAADHRGELPPGETVSSIAGRRGVAPNLLYRWRRLLTEGGAAAVGSDEPVVASSEVRRLEERVRDLERLLGRKTMEVEILKEALAKSESKNRACGCCRSRRTVPDEGRCRDARGGSLPSP